MCSASPYIRYEIQSKNTKGFLSNGFEQYIDRIRLLITPHFHPRTVAIIRASMTVIIH